MIYVDAPRWPAHGTVYAHVVSDTSADELHAFAARVGLDPRSWDGDHYDVPLRRYDDVVRAGAQVVDGRTLVRVLEASGLRFRKRRGERPLASLPDVVPGLPVPHRLDVLCSALPAPAPVAGVAVVAHDPDDRLLLVRPRRRGRWETPGGGVQAGEGAIAAALREVHEETGLRLDGEALRPIGYERLILAEPHGRWAATVNHVQVFATRLPDRPVPRAGEILDAEWVAPVGVARRCADAFWWPLLRDHLERSGLL